jgi:hypothetical protein
MADKKAAAHSGGKLSASVKPGTGSADRDFNLMLLGQMADTLWRPEALIPERRTSVARAAFATLKALAPRDEVEGMLAAQMVATHAAAMECLRRAMIENQYPEARDRNLKHAAQLLGVYTRQLEALDKHRARDQPRIAGEPVAVSQGGQPISGDVDAGRRGDAPGRSGQAVPLVRADNLDPKTAESALKARAATAESRRGRRASAKL